MPLIGPLPETTAVLVVRHAVRAWLADRDTLDVVAVGLSGGADSTALTAAAVAESCESAVVHALVVDHGLQPGSAQVAAQAAANATRLGAASARVLAVTVGRDGGIEAAARTARYTALRDAAQGSPVLLGHTLDDQAETVLLGLGRGSGGRSIHGMRAWDAPWGRPLLGVRRSTTRQMCVDLGVEVHDDPHNVAPEFTRVRLRHEVLPLLEDVLGGGVVAALGRTADQLRDDSDVLDDLAADLLDRARMAADLDADLDTAVLASAPAAVRRRAIRSWLLDAGAKAVTATHLYAIDHLVVRWRGQGGVAVGGGSAGARLVASRRRGRLSIDRIC
ncbi:MAG TPA: tRNA lysidine(34) synthetase TilS [Aldersonia sp.]